MNISREDKVAEAVKRMKKLKYYADSIRLFQKDGLLMVNERPFGAHFFVSGEVAEKIKEFEK